MVPEQRWSKRAGHGILRASLGSHDNFRQASAVPSYDSQIVHTGSGMEQTCYSSLAVHWRYCTEPMPVPSAWAHTHLQCINYRQTGQYFMRD